MRAIHPLRTALSHRGHQAHNSTRRHSTYFDSQSGQHVKILQGVQRHAVFRSSNKIVKVPSPASLASAQLGETAPDFAALLPALRDSAPKLFAAVQSAGDVDKVKRLAQGVAIDVRGLAGLPAARATIERARAENLDCRCNLIDCFDFCNAASVHGNALRLATLVGGLADLDVGVIMLRVGAAEAQMAGEAQWKSEDEECTHDALQIVADEVYGLDCVGAPLRARFGVYSVNKGLEEWARRELNTRNSLEIYD